MKKNAIINVATGRYIHGQSRLAKSIQGMDMDFHGFTSEQQINAPPHTSNPYSFKTHAFRWAFAQGHYENVLWVDASVWAIKDVAPIFEHIIEHGYIMQHAGHMVGRWTNDRALYHYGIDRDDAMKMPMYGNAGFLGLSIESNTAMDFLNEWHKSSMSGMFRGAWTNKNGSESLDARCDGHRHDMSCGSIIANQLNMDYQSGDEWLAYASPDDAVNDSIILKAQGM